MFERLKRWLSEDKPQHEYAPVHYYEGAIVALKYRLEHEKKLALRELADRDLVIVGLRNQIEELEKALKDPVPGVDEPLSSLLAENRRLKAKLASRPDVPLTNFSYGMPELLNDLIRLDKNRMRELEAEIGELSPEGFDALIDTLKERARGEVK